MAMSGDKLPGHHAREVRAKYLLPKADDKRVAEDLYRLSGQPFLCDPRDLILAIHLRARAEEVAEASILEGVLLYPEHAALAERGWSIYQALARHLLQTRHLRAMPTDITSLAGELALPSRAQKAYGRTVYDLHFHVPARVLAQLLLRGHQSGIYERPSFGRS